MINEELDCELNTIINMRKNRNKSIMSLYNEISKNKLNDDQKSDTKLIMKVPKYNLIIEILNLPPETKKHIINMYVVEKVSEYMTNIHKNNIDNNKENIYDLIKFRLTNSLYTLKYKNNQYIMTFFAEKEKRLESSYEKSKEETKMQ